MTAKRLGALAPPLREGGSATARRRTARPRTGRRPAAEEPDPLVGGRARFGGVDKELKAWVLGDFEPFEAERHVADDMVTEALHPRAVATHVVGTPLRTELLAARGQLTEQGTEAGLYDGAGLTEALNAARTRHAGQIAP